eukprot:scaffold2161_cov244-Pinguiococcus_pyrenoidosus.AAC.11
MSPWCCRPSPLGGRSWASCTCSGASICFSTSFSTTSSARRPGRDGQHGALWCGGRLLHAIAGWRTAAAHEVNALAAR